MHLVSCLCFLSLFLVFFPLFVSVLLLVSFFLTIFPSSIPQWHARSTFSRFNSTYNSIPFESTFVQKSCRKRGENERKKEKTRNESEKDLESIPLKGSNVWIIFSIPSFLYFFHFLVLTFSLSVPSFRTDFSLFSSILSHHHFSQEVSGKFFRYKTETNETSFLNDVLIFFFLKNFRRRIYFFCEEKQKLGKMNDRKLSRWKGEWRITERC